MNTKSKAAALSIASNTTLIILKVIAGILTGSISLIAEAVHSTMDLAAAVIAFFSVRISDNPADEQHPFGHGKAENISGVAEGLLIFVAAGIIIFEAVQKLITPHEIELVQVGVGLMSLSIVVNVFVSRQLMKVSKKTDSLALEADSKHLSTDVLTMGGVLIGLALYWITGNKIFDPITALIVALVIIKAAYDITKRSFGGLMDTTLPKAEVEEISAIIKEHASALAGFHEMRTRKAGSQRFIDLHLVLPRKVDVQQAHDMCDHLEQDIKSKMPNSSITIHVEPCSAECDNCTVVCTCRVK